VTITLVTGANKGLGRETARRLVDADHTVLQHESEWPQEKAPRHADRDRGTDVIVRLATLPPDGPTGTAQLREGVATPW
jgi:NAD(P)-dependent dehydrogenase (short-subunit alcohol dehydrogenase family)